MALFNTLFLFPVAIEHGGSEQKPFGSLLVPLATYVEWYWRVRRWSMTATIGGNSVTQEFEQTLDGTNPLTDETQLLLGASGTVSISGPTTTSTADSRDGDYVSIGSIFGRTCYDPTSGSYLWDEAGGFISNTLPDNSLQGVLFPASASGDQSVTVALTMDGLQWSVPGRSAYYPAQGASATPPALTCTCQITAVLYWGWGGKYDTTTGAPL